MTICLHQVPADGGRGLDGIESPSYFDI